jgi:ABC-type phosphate transport system substrate-binding protein
MKKVKFALLVLLAAILVLPSCKKGENDPFMSLHSRKARVVGEWTLKSGSITYNGSTTVYPQANYTETVEFKGDKTYTRTTVNSGSTSVEKGSWAFSGASKEVELKNKEALILYCTSYSSGSNTTTYTGYYALSGPTILLIDKLANKEMVITYDGNESGGGDSNTLSGTLTYEQ